MMSINWCFWKKRNDTDLQRAFNAKQCGGGDDCDDDNDGGVDVDDVSGADVGNGDNGGSGDDDDICGSDDDVGKIDFGGN